MLQLLTTAVKLLSLLWCIKHNLLTFLNLIWYLNHHYHSFNMTVLLLSVLWYLHYWFDTDFSCLIWLFLSADISQSRLLPSHCHPTIPLVILQYGFPVIFCFMIQSHWPLYFFSLNFDFDATKTSSNLMLPSHLLHKNFNLICHVDTSL